MTGLLLLILIVGHFVTVPAPVEEPQRLVKIIPRPIPVTRVVTPLVHKTVIPHLAHAVVKKMAIKKITQHNVRRQAHAPKQVALNTLGALSVLGHNPDKNVKGGGLQLDAIHTTRGPGLGGTAGSGG